MPAPVTISLLPRRGVPWRRRLREYAIVLPVMYVAWCVAALMIQELFIFPGAGQKALVNVAPRGVESVWIDIGSPAARVEAWFLPPLTVAPGRAPAVVYFHGNAELIDDCTERVRGWRERGYAVLLPEFRGYGRSGGKPSQVGIVEDATRFYDSLAARPDIDASRILLHGRSLGGGVACQLAAARPCAGLVLESTFTSAASFSWSLGVPPFLVRHPFRNDRALPGFRQPVLFLHGKDDTIIPPRHSRRLHEIARGSMLIEMPGGHNDFPLDWGVYWGAIDAFLDLHPTLRPEATSARPPR